MELEKLFWTVNNPFSGLTKNKYDVYKSSANDAVHFKLGE